MAAATVRADYDQLSQVAGAFRQNVEDSQRTLQNLKSSMATLQGGDWIGQGATAFYQEMDNSVLPTLQRLIKALDSAATSVTQISAIMKDAEDQAANVLKGPGGASGPIGAGSAAGAGLGGAIGGVAGLGAAGPMGDASGVGAASGIKADFSYQKYSAGVNPAAGPASAQFVGVKTGGNYDPVKASGAGAPGSPNIASNVVGGQRNDAGSKDPIKEQVIKGNQLGQVGGLANEGWERDKAEFSQMAGKVGGLNAQADKENPLSAGAANLSGGAGNTAGSGNYEWIKASGAAAPGSPNIASNMVGGQRLEPGGKDPIAEQGVKGSQFSQVAGNAAAGNTVGGSNAEWIKASGTAAPSGPKVDTNALGGKISQTWTDSGKTAQDDWTQHVSGANVSGAGGTIDKNSFDFGASGATPIGQGTGPGHLAGQEISEIQGGANTIGGTAAGDLAANLAGAGTAGGAPTPGGSNFGTRESETFQGIEHDYNLPSGASDDWETGSPDPKHGGKGK